MKKILILLIISLSISSDRLTNEKKIYDIAVNSVFKIFGDSGSGTGFLIDNKKGLIITNYHVISESKDVRVKFNDSLKVHAKVLDKSMYNDMAIIQVNPDYVKNLKNLNLQPIDYDLFIGEKVIAIGSPLNQESIMTTGIISKIYDRAIISDVNINPGNSGGPLLNIDAYVIGINTFGDIGNYGPGISGIVKINLLYPMLDKVYKILDNETKFPVKKEFPTMPKDIFPLDSLKMSVYKDFKTSNYKVNSSKFYINVITPPFRYNREKSLKLDLSEIREKRAKKAGIDDSESLDSWIFDDLYSWTNYSGIQNDPVVIIEIAPKIKATGLSVVGALAAGLAAGYAGTVVPPLSMAYKYKSDLENFNLYRDDSLLVDLKHYVDYQPAVYFSRDFYGNTQSIKDLAKSGVYYFSIYDFAPVNNKFSDFKIEINDLVKLNKIHTIEIKSETIKQIWEDFLPYTKRYDEWNEILEIEKKYKQGTINKVKTGYPSYKPKTSLSK